MRLTLEQIDLIRLMCASYSELELVTSLKGRRGTCLVVQTLRLYASTAGGSGLIPGGGTKSPHAARHGQKQKGKVNRLVVVGARDFSKLPLPLKMII